MAIVGKESITVVSKIFVNEDEYGNPIENKLIRIINNVLVDQSGSTITYGLHDNASEIDISVYLSYNEKINSNDEFIYNGRTYHQIGVPTLWKPAMRSTIKPKLIVNLKAVD